MNGRGRRCHPPATLLSKIGWSPAGPLEETLFQLATGKIDDLKKGGGNTARILSEIVPTMPSSVQNSVVDILSGIGGREGIIGLAQIVSGDYGAVSDVAAESLADMDKDILPIIREVAVSQKGDGRQRLEKIIRKVENGR